MKTFILNFKRSLLLHALICAMIILVGMSLISSQKAFAQDDGKSKIHRQERLEWKKYQKELMRQERLYNSQKGSSKISDIHEFAASLFVDETATRLPVDNEDSNGVDFADVDGDGDFDIIIANDGQNKLYINDGTGHFVDETSARLPNDNFASYDVEFGDVDNDGDLDIFVANEYGDPDRLLVNSGAGIFEDVTRSRLPDEPWGRDSGKDVEFGDIDGDGDLDIVIANDFDDQNRLLINDGSGNFSDGTDSRLPADSDDSQDLDLGDVDNDGDLDIIIANGFGSGEQNRLLINNGNGILKDETNLRLPTLQDKTRGVAFGDVDGDGDVDIFFANVSEESRILINSGSGNFVDETSSRLPIGMDFNYDATFSDVDQDGDLDIFVADVGQDELLINNGAGFFTVDDFPSERDFGSDAEFMDVDGDGDIDLIVTNIVLGTDNPQNRLYINTLSVQLPVDPNKTLVVANPDTIPADGVSTSTITVTPKDSQGINLGAGQNVVLATTAGTLLNTVSDEGDGSYTQELQSSTIPGTAIITATVNGVEMNQKPQVVFISTVGVGVRIDPPQVNRVVGDTLTVNVAIDGVTNLGSFQFEIEYGTSVVHADTAWLGPFLSSSGRTASPVGPTTDNNSEPGKITFGGFTIGTANGPDGSGILATVKFTTQDTGRTILTLKNVQVTDINGQEQSLAVIRDGHVTVGVTPPQVDPVNTTVVADPDTIAADGESTSIITVIPKDALNKNLGTGQTVVLATTAGTLLNTVSDNGDDTYTQELQSTPTTGTATIFATVNGIVMNQKPVVVFDIPVGINDKVRKNLPEEFTLSQNYPNPFNPETTIEYQIHKRSRVTIIIYNLMGQEIVMLVNEEKEAGNFKTIWDGKDSFGEQVASGIYVYEMRAGEFITSKKLAFIR